MSASRDSSAGGASAGQGDFDAIVVGAGFAGMYMLHRLRGMGLRVRVFETGKGVGGTWYWNRYPGARCDVESMQYSYQFSSELQQEWDWSERYSPQPEILRYAEHVADRFDLRRDIRFETRVVSAAFDEAADLWTVATDRGERVTARFVVMATGCLSSTNKPKFEGLESFRGPVYHTGEWPHEEPEFSGMRLGVIGTGSSAIQSIPILAERAASLVVFQRTANYTIPAHNAPLDPDRRSRIKAEYPALRARARTMPSGIDLDFNAALAAETPEEERQRVYAERWRQGGLTFMGSFSDLLLNPAANETAAEFVRGKIREIVKDPELARKLSPTNVIGCKRLCVDTGYWETFNRPHVELVDVGEEPIRRILPDGVEAGGRRHALDALVFATGFDAMTGAMLRIDIAGRSGRRLKDKWSEGPKSYLGLSVAGFPNLFTVTGPGSPSVLTNMLPSIEQHVDWIAACIGDLRARGVSRIEAESAAEEAWVAHVRDVAGGTLRSTCSSWYVGANVPGKPRVFMPYIGGLPAYVKKCEEVVAQGYAGFALGR